MNSKVDVLAVLDGRVASLTFLQDDARLEGNDHLADELEEGELLEWREARAAVAELIEAAQAMRLEASRLRGDFIPSDTLADFDAALTRVTGA